MPCATFDYHDEAFIVNAYRGVLRREPDSSGMTDFLGKLRHGDYTKIEILGRLALPGRATPRGPHPGSDSAVRAANRLPPAGVGLRYRLAEFHPPPAKALIRNWQRFEAHSAFHADQNHRIQANRSAR